jgi:very-short-patch-repair endonuclease
MTQDTPRYVVDLARQNRKNPTPTEKDLWNIYETENWAATRFEDSIPLDDILPIFIVPQAKVVFEIDGKIHDRTEVKEYDEIRQREIESRGLRVVRIKNDLVIDDLEKTLSDIERELNLPKVGESEK